jgi:uncharacterized membrane protein
MIGDGKNETQQQTNKEFVALRDAFVVFLLVLITHLLAVPYPPNPEVVWIPFLTGLLMGIISYMRALGIKSPESTSL